MTFKFPFEEGRTNFPVNTHENLIEKLQMSRNSSFAPEIQGIGDLKEPALNQSVGGGFNIQNLQTTGPMREKPVIPVKGRVLTKYENKRRDTQTTEALYDWRNNVSMNNEGKVTPNYYLNSLNERAKSKVFNKPSINYRFQQEKPSKTFEEFKSQHLPQTFYDVAEIESSDSGLIKFNADGCGSVAVNPTTYNPFLAISSGNKPNGTMAYPDERMTHYGGERAFMSKGDRIKMATDLANSEYNKERRQLQNEANDALKGIVHAPRQVASFGRGINTTFRDDGYSSHDININQREREEAFVPRSSDFHRQAYIQQQVDINEGEKMREIKKDVIDKTIQRQIHKDNDDPSLFTKIIETFKSIFWNDENKSEIKDRLTVKEKFHMEADYVDPIEHNVQVDNIKIDPRYMKRMFTVEKNIKKEYLPEIIRSGEEIHKPKSILKINDKTVLRTIATRNSNTVRVLQKREEHGQTDNVKYLTAEIPINVVEEFFGKRFDSETNETRLLNLTPEEHILLVRLVEEMPDKFKYESATPIHYYQRDLLENGDDYITNIIIEEHPQSLESERFKTQQDTHQKQMRRKFDEPGVGDSVEKINGEKIESRDYQKIKVGVGNVKNRIKRFDS